MGKVLYVITTHKCNLRCAHCYVNYEDDYFNEEKFLKELNSFEGKLILFGGEFTADMDRFRKIVKSNKEYGISKFSTATTNLIKLDDELLEFYKTLNSLGTSWNLDRFGTNNIYQQWLKNVKTIVDTDIDFGILITLTKDLINKPATEFLKIAKDFNYENANLKFEQYIGEDVGRDHYEKVDEWLCDLYKNWDLKTPFRMKNKVKNWYLDCNETYSLSPDGTLRNRCAHNLPPRMAKECLTCPDAINCRPCRLIPYCSYPRKLAKLIKEEEGK